MALELCSRDPFLAWPIFRRVQRQAHLFGEMLEHSGADPAAAIREGRGSAFAQAARRCLACPHAAACRDWLDGENEAAVPSFCLNAAYLRRLKD